MGLGGISIWQLLIILLIVVLLFGSGKLRSLGSDLGSAVRDFRKGLKDGDKDAQDEASVAHEEGDADGKGDEDQDTGR